MNEIPIRWVDGINGGLIFSGQDSNVVKTITSLAAYVRDHSNELSPKQLRALGATGFFFVIRDYGKSASGSILTSSQRALDSFYFVTGNKEYDASLQAGIKTLLESLIEFRSENYERILKHAFQNLTGIFDMP